MRARIVEWEKYGGEYFLNKLFKFEKNTNPVGWAFYYFFTDLNSHARSYNNIESWSLITRAWLWWKTDHTADTICSDNGSQFGTTAGSASSAGLGRGRVFVGPPRLFSDTAAAVASTRKVVGSVGMIIEHDERRMADWNRFCLFGIGRRDVDVIKHVVQLWDVHCEICSLSRVN